MSLRTFTNKVDDLRKLVKAEASKGSQGSSQQIPSNVEPVFDDQDSDSDQQDQQGQEDQQSQMGQQGQEDQQKDQQGQEGQQKDQQKSQQKDQQKDKQKDQQKDKQEGQQGAKAPDLKLPKGQSPLIEDIPLDPNELKDVKGMPGSSTKSETPIDTDKLREMVRKAEEITETEKRSENKQRQISPGGGGKPGAFRSLSSSDYPTKRDWKNILRDVVSKISKVPTNLVSNPRMRALGTKVHVPGSVTSRQGAEIIVTIDTSGSIDDVILNGFMSDLRKIFDDFRNDKTFGVKVILWADTPYADSPIFRGKEFIKCKDWVQSHWRIGGNDIDALFAYINDTYKKQFEGIVWLTDAELRIPKVPIPDAYNIFIIVGEHMSGYVKEFLAYLINQKGKGKPPKIIRTNYRSNTTSK